jgi:hypothetical protein
MAMHSNVEFPGGQFQVGMPSFFSVPRQTAVHGKRSNRLRCQ